MWAANYTAPAQIKEQAAFPFKYHIETFVSGKPKPIETFQMMRWENLDALENSQDSIMLPSQINQKFPIVPNVVCHTVKGDGLIVNNYSKMHIYMQTSEGIYEIVPGGVSIPIAENGTYTFWLDNKEKTGFIITRRI